MASVNIVLRRKATKDGTFPLAIRITKERKSSYIFVGQSISEKDWDEIKERVKKSHPNSARLNNMLVAKLAEANDKLLETETNKKPVSAKGIKKIIKPSSNEAFFGFAEIYLEDLKTSGKYNRYAADKPRINHFREFLKDEDINFPEISVHLLERFRAWLKGTRNVSERTIINHLIVIRTIFNLAVKAGKVDLKYYPFGKGGVQIKIPESVKIGLSQDEVAKLETLELEAGSYPNHARNVWLFSFYFAGMRLSDVLRLKWIDFTELRLHYKMGKNQKQGSLKTPEKALLIIKQYETAKTKKDDLVFPELKVLDDLSHDFQVQKKIAFADKRLNKALKKVAELAGIEKKLTMHIARHTFGNLSGDKIPVQMLQKLYRHSSITTTIGYQANFIHKDADDALDAVISF